MRRLLYIFSLSLSVLSATAQDDVFDLLDEESESTQYTYATFKGTKLLNGQTNETPGQGVLQYIISHRFGSFTDEYLYNFFGLDNEFVRLLFRFRTSLEELQFLFFVCEDAFHIVDPFCFIYIDVLDT